VKTNIEYSNFKNRLMRFRGHKKSSLNSLRNQTHLSIEANQMATR
jgi:hypothetical protein